MFSHSEEIIDPPSGKSVKTIKFKKIIGLVLINQNAVVESEYQLESFLFFKLIDY